MSALDDFIGYCPKHGFAGVTALSMEYIDDKTVRLSLCFPKSFEDNVNFIFGIQ